MFQEFREKPFFVSQTFALQRFSPFVVSPDAAVKELARFLQVPSISP